MLLDDNYFMRQVLLLAQQSFEDGEVPVGAIIVYNQQIIAKAHNTTERLNDVTAHAEILAITSASNYLQSKYLTKCTLYVNLEPCVMCAGAIAWAQIGRLVYGSSDEKRGFSQYQNILPPKTKCTSGIMATESSQLLRLFFQNLRK